MQRNGEIIFFSAALGEIFTIGRLSRAHFRAMSAIKAVKIITGSSCCHNDDIAARFTIDCANLMTFNVAMAELMRRVSRRTGCGSYNLCY